LAWLLSLSLSAACEAPASHAKVEEPTPAEFRTLVYSRAFAQRFRLPDQGVYTLDPGLQAIALHVGRNQRSNPHCQIDLYLDDGLAVFYPSGTGGREVDTTENGAMFFINELNADDDGFTRERWFPGATILVRSVDVDYKTHKGSFASSSVRAFERDILPDMNYVSFDIVCFALRPESAPFTIWLRRADNKDQLPITPTTEEAYAFSIPNALIAHASGAIRAALSAPVHLEPEKQHTPAYSLPPRQAADAHTTP
jgi:hypothetical protein